MEVIDKIEKARASNNVNWMDVLRLSFRDRNLLLAEVRDYTISGPRNPVVVCFTSLLSSLTVI